jgi:hypothetical protein
VAGPARAAREGDQKGGRRRHTGERPEGKAGKGTERRRGERSRNRGAGEEKGHPPGAWGLRSLRVT